MKKGRSRTISICLTDIPKDRILKHENGKKYLAVSTYDNEEPDKYGNDFSMSIPLTEEELKRKTAGETVKRVYLGNGKIWPDKQMEPLSNEEKDDLHF